MRWFGKRKQCEIWEEDVARPIGDIDAAQRIREICRAAAGSAEKASSPAEPEKTRRLAVERYQRAARAAMEIAMTMSDDLMRDSSIGQIVELCMKAGDLTTARILVRAIGAMSIRQEVLNAYPLLRE